LGWKGYAQASEIESLYELGDLNVLTRSTHV
jgi:hypothetical protein